MGFHVIGFTGPAGAGKDTAAEYFHYRGFHRWALAQPIKDGLCAMLGVDPRVFQDRERKERVLDPWGRSPRYLAQTLGTEWGRLTVHPEIWLLRAQDKVRDALQSGAPGIVITDVRFDNEAAWVRDLGGTVIEIVRPGLPAVEAHVSETGVRDGLVDWRVCNNSSIPMLHEQLRQIDAALQERDGVLTETFGPVEQYR